MDLVSIRRDFHRHPELAFAEHRTAQVIQEHLHGLGVQSRRCAETGVIADIEGTLPGPLIALRADIDALPIEEETGLPFASEEPGKMHACGHDAHATILLGAAEYLLEHRADMKGRVRLIFQPAEETTSGARAMVDDGALQGVQAIFGLHCDPTNPVGTAAVKAGPVMAASDYIRITVTGRGGHAALPHLSVDPIVAAAYVVTSLQTAVSRVVSPLEPAVVTVGKVVAGTVANVIPNAAVLEGTVRYFSAQVGQEMPAVLRRIVEGIAEGHGCQADLEYVRKVPPVDNDAKLASIVQEVAEAELGAEQIGVAQPTMGAEDFAIYQQQTPGCFFRLGTGGEKPWHHPQFTIDEGCLPIGARLLAQVALAAGAAGL